MKKKIKLRDITKEQYKKWFEENKNKIHIESKILGELCKPILEDFTDYKHIYSDNLLDKEVKIEVPNLLTIREKLYLEGVLRPFKDKVEYIKKDNSCTGYQFISFRLYQGYYFTLPSFETNKYYKNMVAGREYTLKDLGLFVCLFDINSLYPEFYYKYTFSKYKITLSEFWNSKDKLAIHCDTEEKANKLLKAFDKIGQKWDSNDSYLNTNFYKYYNEKTYYTNDNLYGNCENLLAKKYKIFDFDEVDLEH